MKNEKKQPDIRQTPQKIILVSLAAVCALALLFGAVFGTVVLVRNARAVMKYEGNTVDEATYSYFASVCKARYLSSLRAQGIAVSDTDAFFASDSGDGTTHGEALAAYTESYVRSLLVSVYLFDRTSVLTDKDKETIDNAVSDLLKYSEADGNKAAFDKLTEKYGFGYKNLQKIATMLYKTNKLFRLLYGENAANTAYDTAACNSFYNEKYVRVRLLFIRTKDTFVYDEDGNRVKDGSGNDLTEPLSPAEVESRAADIARLDAAMEARKNGENGAMTDVMLRQYAEDKYAKENDATYAETGYYFSSGSKATTEAYADFPEVVTEALRLGEGEFAKVTTSVGVCYIYRDTLVTGAYADEDLSAFFSDFYARAATALCNAEIEKRTPDVIATDRLSRINVVSVPYNSDFTVRFS